MLFPGIDRRSAVRLSAFLAGFRLPFAVSNISTSHPIILLVACLWIVSGGLFSAFVD